jgi:hypothetical protein
MVTDRAQRRLNGVLGVFLLVVAGVGIVLLGGELDSEPMLAVQIALLGLAGLCDVLAAVEKLPGLRWYQWSGLGNILLGFSLPLGFSGFASPVYVVLMLVGGLSLAALGGDMLLFHGEYTRSSRLDADLG